MIEHLTFKEIYSRVERFVQDSSTSRETRIKDAINNNYDDVSNRYDWPQLHRFVASGLATVASQPKLFLPKDCKTLLAIGQTTDPHLISHKAGNAFLGGFLDTSNTTGSEHTFTDEGWFSQKAVIAAAEKLRFVSTSAADTIQTFLVRGLVNGQETRETVTLQGTSNVDTSNTYDPGVSILSISSDSQDRVGNVTVSGVTSSAVYAIIAPVESTARYRCIRLHYTPAAADTVIISYVKSVEKMTSDDDVPEMPVGRYLVEKSIGDIFAQQRKWQPAQYHLQLSERVLMDLMAVHEMQGMRIKQGYPAHGSDARAMVGWTAEKRGS